MGDFDEARHPREHGKFVAAGGARHNSSAGHQARKASRAAQAASEGAETAGEHQGASSAHRDAAKAHLASAEAHHEAAKKATDPASRSEHQAAATTHEAEARKHEGKAGDHASEAKSAPEKKGLAAWVAKRLEGAGEGLSEAREKLEEGGEHAQEAEEKALEGDPLKGIQGAAGAVGERLAAPLGAVRAGGAVAKHFGKEGGGKEKEEGEEE